MRRTGYALLMVLGMALTVGLAAALMAVRMAQEADQGRLEAEKALAQVSLDGHYNELLLVLGGSLKEEVRNALTDHAGSGRFAFGSGGEAPTQSSVASDMAPLAQAMQNRADALLCSQGYRLYLSDMACGEALPNNVRLAQPGFVSGNPRTGGPAAIQKYRLPFVAYARGVHGDAMQEKYMLGSYEFDLGAALASRYGLLLDNAYDSAGNLHLFDDHTVLEGRLHVAGILGVRAKPWFAGAVTSGSCPSLGVDGTCVGNSTPGMAFYNQGFVEAATMLPRLDQPCLGPDCPVWGEGVDLAQSGLRAGGFVLSGWAPTLTLTGDARQVRLWPEGGIQHLEVCDAACYTYRVNGQRLERQSLAGWVNEIGLPLDGPVVRLRLEVRGQIERLSAGNSFGLAVAEGVSVEIVARNNVRVISSLAYENSPCSLVGGRSEDRMVPSRCTNLGATGRLVVVSTDGNIWLGYGNADSTLNLDEDNPRLHGQFVAPRGSIGTENLAGSEARRGTAFVLGSLTMNRWADWGDASRGWHLSLTYDPRLANRPFIVEEPVLSSGVLGVFLRIEGEQRPD